MPHSNQAFNGHKPKYETGQKSGYMNVNITIQNLLHKWVRKY